MTNSNALSSSVEMSFVALGQRAGERNYPRDPQNDQCFLDAFDLFPSTLDELMSESWLRGWDKAKTEKA